jgi:hypothetical protein
MLLTMMNRRILHTAIPPAAVESLDVNRSTSGGGLPVVAR